MDPESRGDQQQ
jgi:hypothetical protein